MERVSVIQGKKPVILVAPHCADDVNTEIVTEAAAKKLNCYAVINRGFNRSDTVDVNKDMANCNRVDHAKEPVVFEEFLKPIVKITTKLTKISKDTYEMFEPIHIFHIHGCKNHEAMNGERVGLVVGYGLGTQKNSFSCDEWLKNSFINYYRQCLAAVNTHIHVYSGKGGGKYAGRDSNNMNQYFRKHDKTSYVHSMQLEFPYNERKDSETAKNTGILLANAIELYMHFSDEASITIKEEFI